MDLLLLLLPPVLDTEYAFQSYNTAGPSAGIYIVGIAAIPGLA